MAPPVLKTRTVSAASVQKAGPGTPVQMVIVDSAHMGRLEEAREGGGFKVV